MLHARADIRIIIIAEQTESQDCTKTVQRWGYMALQRVARFSRFPAMDVERDDERSRTLRFNQRNVRLNKIWAWSNTGGDYSSS
jgi:hypothetical protein